MSELCFTSQEASRLSGVTLDRQNDWRRRGILPAKARPIAFDLREVCELRLARLLIDDGFGVGEVFAMLDGSVASWAVTDNLVSQVLGELAAPGETASQVLCVKRTGDRFEFIVEVTIEHALVSGRNFDSLRIIPLAPVARAMVKELKRVQRLREVDKVLQETAKAHGFDLPKPKGSAAPRGAAASVVRRTGPARPRAPDGVQFDGEEA